MKNLRYRGKTADEIDAQFDGPIEPAITSQGMVAGNGRNASATDHNLFAMRH
jgi:hypothetical protein